jgi:WD40 repeat protein
MNFNQHLSIELNWPVKCAASWRCIAVATLNSGVDILKHDGSLMYTLPDFKNATAVAFHPRRPNILAIGFQNGSTHLWDTYANREVFSCKMHTSAIASVRFASDGRLLLSSWDNTASAVTINELFHTVSYVKLEGHADWVNDILPLHSNQCVTCSDDFAVKVWDCQTGMCLQSINEHKNCVKTISMSSGREVLASGSWDLVILISSEDFTVRHRIEFAAKVQLLAFGDHASLFVGLYDYGVMTCNIWTRDVEPTYSSTGSITGLTYCNRLREVTPSAINVFLSATVPVCKLWTPSTHATWSLPAQHSIHLVLVLFYKMQTQGAKVRVPYELEEIILKHVV